MNRLSITPAASALFRALTARAGLPADRAMLTDVVSTEWHSLTLSGERHRIGIRFAGPQAGDAAHRMCAGLEEAEFPMPGLFVADIGLAGPVECEPDGCRYVRIEALTIRD